MILFCTPDVARPSGGIRSIYRSVDLLNDAGHDAAVLHRHAGFRCNWFDNTTRVVHPPVAISGHDVLVVPEAFTPADMERLPLGVPKVVFNQNAHRTFASASRRDGTVVATTADHPDVAAVLTVSEHDRALLDRALPDARVVRLHHWIDASIFHPDSSPPSHRVVAMPRKRPADFRLLLDLLEARGALIGDWEVCALEGRPEHEVAAELGRAALFVALGREEGFGLPVAEALASGCAVVGYHGGGGRELFECDAATAIEDGDIGALAMWVEEFVAGYEASRAQWERLGVAAAEFVASTYSRERATSDLVACFSRIPARVEIGATTITKKDLPSPSITERARDEMVRLGRRYVSRS